MPQQEKPASLDVVVSDFNREPPKSTESVATMTIEGTTIVNSSERHLGYFFTVKDGDRRVYTSRKTLLDRPCWRDDLVELSCPDTAYRVEVFRSDIAETELQDTLAVGPLSALK